MRILKRTIMLTKEEVYLKENEPPTIIVTERVEVHQEWDKEEYFAVLGIPRDANIHEETIGSDKVYIQWSTREKK